MGRAFHVVTGVGIADRQPSRETAMSRSYEHAGILARVLSRPSSFRLFDARIIAHQL